MSTKNYTPTMATKGSFPTHDELMWPTLQAIRRLGGSATIEEIVDKIVEIEQFPEDIQNVRHTKGNRTKLEYRAAWARTYLKFCDAIENSSRGVWSITKLGETLNEADLKALTKKIKEARPRDSGTGEELETDLIHSENISQTWKDELLLILQKLAPSDFEKLSQRLLREAGFVKVVVTGKSGDGGIDGAGVLRVNLLSFQVLFQCKRYKGSVSSSAIRDFRGAMVGRSDKGLMITTGSFTSEARKEATRDGAPAIDLIDGSEFCDLIKNLRLGVKVETIESVSIDKNWFAQL